MKAAIPGLTDIEEPCRPLSQRRRLRDSHPARLSSALRAVAQPPAVQKTCTAYVPLKHLGAALITVEPMTTETGHPPTSSSDTFAACLRQVRNRLEAKQIWLAREVGCTEAAISHWEKGSRLPKENTDADGAITSKLSSGGVP